MLKEDKVFVTSGKKTGNVRKETKCSVRHESIDRTKPTPKNVFAVGALVTSELTAEHRLRLTEDLRNLHPKGKCAGN